MLTSDSDYNPKVKLDFNTSNISAEEQPFRILFLGNWSGRKINLVNLESSSSQPIEIDKDNFDQLLNRFNVTVDLEFSDTHSNVLSLRFEALEDFHPDNIFQQLPLFSELRDLRRRLLDPKTYDKAAIEIKSWLDNSELIVTGSSIENIEKNVSSNSLPDDWFDQVLSQKDQKKSSQANNSETSELSIFIRNIVEPHIIQVDVNERAELLMVIDEVISDLMRKILHHPQFQSLESAWRGLFLLVRRLETSSKLKIFLLDTSKSELSRNLKLSKDTGTSSLQEILNRQDSNFNNVSFWAMFCADFTFSLTVEDVATLIRISESANLIGAPFVSYIKPEMFVLNASEQSDNLVDWRVSENSSEDELWTALRVIPETEYIGLAVARFLGRLPYGEDTEPIEAFNFEEFTDSATHENYLWVNPTFIIALLIAQTYCVYGWDITQNLFRKADNFPLHLSINDGVSKIKSCVEFEMSVSEQEKVIEQGLLSLVSYKNADEIRFAHLHSITFPSTFLRGRWR